MNTRSDFVFLSINGQMVVGEIAIRQKYYIRVNIVKPYTNWWASLSIPGMARKYTKNFLTEEGDKSARDLLAGMYRKISRIDRDMDRLSRVYRNYRHLCKFLDEQITRELYKPDVESIKSSLTEWFYELELFTPSITGLSPNYDEKKILEEIFEEYLHSGKKIYLVGSEN
jgi:hypothetical protein